MEDLMFNTRFKAKEFQRQAAKFDKEAEKYKQKARAELQKNDKQCASMYATQSSSLKQQAYQFKLLSVQLETASNQLKMKQAAESFTKEISSLNVSLGKDTANPVEVQKTMDQFQHLMDGLGVNLAVMQDAMQPAAQITHGDVMQELEAEMVAQSGNDVILSSTKPRIVEDAGADSMNDLMDRINAI
ncbi:SNF7 family protein [Spironucleus salmonicida]|uniref:SNF7 family protein n=1 Tax=Spironucleus salmonicida TaxID=348837 RepID=V6LVW6_9EUKA|nr:SNF7 family protein [Spironucleus salmonicida]|eukprot:EST48772.1 SNF7 family protein [Spironucleus salmonicida]